MTFTTNFLSQLLLLVMNCFNDKLKLDAFKEKTTYLTDYKQYCNVKRDSVKPARPVKEKPVKPPPPKHYEDQETFSKWKDKVYVPFNLFFEPKPIIQTDPRKPFIKLAPLPEDDKLKALKTRPRIYMAPACSMDDVPDPEIRSLLCDYMYTTEWRKSEIEGASGFKSKTPNIAKINTKDTVSLQLDLYPPLEEKFLCKGKKWDDSQRRGSSDPTKDFWVHKDPPVICGACVNPVQNLVPQGVKEEIKQAIREDKLRLAHDLPPPSYAGYKPRSSNGVSISKWDTQVTNPMLTVAQAITARYAMDSRK